MAKNPDQWHDEGDCGACRRNSYCNKSCRAHKMWMDRAVRMIVNKKIAEHFMARKQEEKHDDGLSQSD